MPLREEVASWLHEAQADLRHAHTSLKAREYNWACFAAQQAAEKALKTAILHILGEYPRGHDLVKLYRTLKEHATLNLSEAKLSRLSAYYTQARYPNAGVERPSEEIAEEQALEAIDTAEETLNEIRKALQDP